MATNASRRRAAAELEARIAQLDERLRLAKAVSVANGGDVGNNNNSTNNTTASNISAAALGESGLYDPTLSPVPKAGALPSRVVAAAHDQLQQNNKNNAAVAATNNNANTSFSANETFNRSAAMPNVTPVRPVANNEGNASLYNNGAASSGNTPASGYFDAAATVNDFRSSNLSVSGLAGNGAGVTPMRPPMMMGNNTNNTNLSAAPSYNDGCVTSPLYVDPNRLGPGVRGAADGAAAGGAAGGNANGIYGVSSVPPASSVTAMAPYTHSNANGLVVSQSPLPHAGANASNISSTASTNLGSTVRRQQQQQQQPQINITNTAPSSAAAAVIHLSGYEAYSSPWREAAFRSQLEANAQLQITAVDTRGRRLDAMLKDVEATNTEVAEKDAQLLWYTARKDSTAAEMHRYLKESNDKIGELERAETRAITDTAQMKLEVEKAQQQLKEVREAMMRATDRSHAINAEKAQLEASMMGSTEASGAKESSEADWHKHHKDVIMHQLKARIAAMSEEVKTAQERFTSREQALLASRAAGANEIKALCSEIDTSRGILADLSHRSEALTAELNTQKQHAAHAAQQRQQKAAEAEQKRRHALGHELGRCQAENAAIVKKMTQQADLITAQLEGEGEDLTSKLAKTSKAREAAAEVNAALAEKLATLKAAVQRKQDAEPECQFREQEVTSLLAARDENKAQIGALQRAILQSQDEVRSLEIETSRLNELLDEESRLKTLLASLSQEMASSNALRQEDLKQYEETAKVIEAAHSDALAKVAVAENELHRVKASNAAILDSLTRKLHDAREKLATKEKSLDELLTKNTQLQNTIIQYEEEKRKMERDAMVRKEAASRAAKAALLDLA